MCKPTIRTTFTLFALSLMVVGLIGCGPAPSVALRVDCGTLNHKGAEVRVNDEFKGECPVEVMVVPGPTKIEARISYDDTGFDYAQIEQQLVADTGKSIQLDMKRTYPSEYYERKGSVFRDNGDGTVTDPVTNLTWQRCSVGQSWTGNTCAGEAAVFTWDAAMALGKDGWRLPTLEELETLVFCSSGPRERYCKGDYQKPTINQNAFPGTPGTLASKVWSASPSAINSAGAWFVNFYYGTSSDGSGRGSVNGVRLVRSGQ